MEPTQPARRPRGALHLGNYHIARIARARQRATLILARSCSTRELGTYPYYKVRSLGGPRLNSDGEERRRVTVRVAHPVTVGRAYICKTRVSRVQ